MANYYKATKIRKKYGAIFDQNGNEINERERGLDGKCEGTDKQHEWLLLPAWNMGVEDGGKQYIYCLRCGEYSHL